MWDFAVRIEETKKWAIEGVPFTGPIFIKAFSRVGLLLGFLFEVEKGR